jgi:hypothetical protein
MLAEMNWLRTRFRTFWRRIKTVEAVRDEQEEPGDGPVAPDVFRNIPPGAGGPGV